MEAEAKSTATYESRGVYFFDGRVRCPMAGVGSRGEYASNRVALDNGDSAVTVEPGLITVDNRVRYPDKSVIADLTFLAEGIHAGGDRSPFAIHLKVFKTGDKVSVDLHRHLRSQREMVGVEVEPYEVVVTDGRRRQTVLDAAAVAKLCKKPGLVHRAIKAMMAMRDNLEGVRQDPAEPGFKIADLSLGFGAGPLAWMMCRAELVSLSPDNAELIRGAPVSAMLAGGDWELRLSIQTDKYLPDVVKRDLFLFGLDRQPLLSEARERGLRKGQTMSFRFEGGEGALGVDGAVEPMPGALDVARDYIEFHMLGGLLAEEAERVSRQYRV